MLAQRFSAPLGRLRFLAIGACLVAGLLALGSPSVLAQSGRPAPRPAPVYTAMLRTGEQGSHIMGNPEARVRLAEYVSYTCPHCAHFAADATQTLRTAYVARGTVSLEVRHVVRDPVDLAMATATNCGAPARFFSRHEAMMGQHDAIMTRVRALPQATLEQWGTLPMAQRLLSDAEGAIEMQFANNQAKFSFDGMEFVTKLVEGKFPDYNRVIPKNHKNSITLGRAPLLASLQRAAILTSEKFKGVRVNLEPGLLQAELGHAQQRGLVIHQQDGSGPACRGGGFREGRRCRPARTCRREHIFHRPWFSEWRRLHRPRGSCGRG